MYELPGRADALAAAAGDKGALVAISLTNQDVLLDVHVVHDRVALVVGDRTLWLDGREVELLRHKLVLATRELSMRSVPLPEPRARR